MNRIAVVLLLLVISLVDARLRPIRAQPPRPGPAADLVLFSSDRGGEFQLYVMSLDGSGVRKVVDTPGKAFENALACNGRIATVVEEPGTPWHSLWTVNLDGSDLRELTPGQRGEHMPTWRPDGFQIAFSSHRGPSRDIWVIQADGSGERAVTTDPRDELWPHWSPDAGLWAVQVGETVGAMDLYTVTPDGGTYRRVTMTGDAGEPRWGPGGTSLVYARRTVGEADIWLVDVASAATRAVVSGPSYDHQPTWMPDGSRILFVRGRESDPDAEIWSVRPDGSDPQNFTNAPASRELWPATACLSPAAPTPTPQPTPGPIPPVSPAPVYLPLALREQCEPERRPLDVVLVMDASTSMMEPTSGGRTKLAAAQASVRVFLEQLSLGRDQAALVAFNRTATLLAGLTTDRTALDRALNGLSVAQQTRIHLGIQHATAELLGPRHRSDSMPVMIVLTDGRANPEPVDEAVRQAASAKAAGITMYIIGLGSQIERDALRRMASRPDTFYQEADAEQLAEIYRAIAVALPCPAEAFWARRP